MPTLYIAGMPIDGDFANLPPRTIEVLKKADFVIAEEKKTAHRLLAGIGEREKPFFLLNEHDDDNSRMELATKMYNASTVVLFSDAGTPCVADPDPKFVDICHSMGITVRSLPGPSSLMTALSVCGFGAQQFQYLGFPPRDKRERALFFQGLAKTKVTTLFLERPYALDKTLAEMTVVKREIAVCMNLGMADELTLRGTPKDLKAQLAGKKAPFVIVIPGH